MKNLILAALLTIGLSASAQTAPYVVLSWPASPSATAANPGSVTIYRAPGACVAGSLGTLSYVVIAKGITALTYTDQGLAAGSYCYYGVFVQSGLTSLPSNTFTAVIAPPVVTPPVLPATIYPLTGVVHQ